MRARLSIVACALAVLALPGSGWASEIWVAPTDQQDLGGLGIGSNGVWPVTPIGAVRLAWGVPEDLETFTSARVVLIPHAPGGTATLNLFVCAAASGDMAAAACTGPHAHPFTGVANQLIEVDVSAALAPQVGVAGVNHLAVVAFTTPTTATDHIVGLRFAYDAVPPDGVATLGANTFTGTQMAPAFAGDGSGLTNVPLPAGAATLGVNVFTGTQTAPAFIGDGSGLTNLPFPAGAASLAANTFSGTQTINGANLDLDPSTATTGLVTKNGAPFLHNFGSFNTFLGQTAGNLTMTGGGNTASGHSALSSNTTGFNNTAIGREALQFNTGGIVNTATGASALRNNITGDFNTAVGVSALLDNSAGNGNTAVGNAALLRSSTGLSNVAIGRFAGQNLLSGSNNIYLGADVTGVADESNTMYLGRAGTQTKTVIAGVRGTAVTGGEMVLIDANGRLGSAPAAPANSVGASEVIDESLTASDLAPNSVGVSEVAFNYAASASEGGAATELTCLGCVAASEVSFAFAAPGANTFTGTQTIDTGNIDLDASTATAGNITKEGTRFLHNFGTGNTFLGVSAGNLSMTGNSNTATGSTAFFANTTGSENTAVGVLALGFNTSGDQNTASGSRALGRNTEGRLNTASGAYALSDNTTGTQNTATGWGALGQNTVGEMNTASGFRALSDNVVGINNTATGSNALGMNRAHHNTAVGRSALTQNTSGSNNVALGFAAGFDATTGSNNIYIGSNVAGVAGESNTMYLGKVGTQTRTFIAGVRGITTLNANAVSVVIDSDGQLGTISSSRRFKEDIQEMGDVSARLQQLRPVTFRYTQPFAGGAKPIQYGLIAEEVAEVFPDLVVSGADGQVETVQYHKLDAMVINELQKLYREVHALKAEVARLKDERQP